jgi:hypothetical protein
MMDFARSATGLTWRKVHDAFHGNDRIRAKAVWDMLTRPRGPLHARTHKQTTWFFASSAQASAWTPPKFNEYPDMHDIGAHIARAPTRGRAPPKMAGSSDRGEQPRPAGPKYVVCPAPKFDSRYQIDPNERIVGGFVSLGIGRYLDE